jgi:hypothetical protein
MFGSYGADRPAPVLQGLELDDLEEDNVKQIIQQELDSALGQDGGTLASERLAALKYYEGEPFGNEVEGRSQVVMRSVLEAVEWVLPALIRIFTASDQICVVEPPLPGTEGRAKQATDYLNHIFYRDNDGFLILHDWFKDALLEKLGWVKYWWDTQRTTETQSYTGLTREQYDALKGTDPDVEVVRERSYPQEADSFNLDRPFVPPPPLPGPPAGMPSVSGTPGRPFPPAGGPIGSAPMPGPPPPPGPPAPSPGAALPSLPPPPVELWDCTLRVTRTNGRARIENVPPEEVLVSRRAKRGDVPFLAHRRRWTKSDLLQLGYDEECLDLVPMDDSMEWNQERVERHKEDDDFPPYERRDGNREIWVEENYCYLGLEGKQTTELYRVTTAGKGLVILTKDGEADIECVPEVPFVSICPVPMSHKLVGMSLADLTMDLQLIKSTLIRQMLDNAWLSNWPRIEVGDDSVNENTYDDLLTLRPGGIVRTKRLGGINALMIPYTADKTFPLVEYLDQTQEVRTGVARHNQGINPDDLNKTATGVSLLQQAAAQRVELFARIFAHGVEQLLRGVMGLVRRHQQQERIIRVTGGWLEVDPRQWREEMPVTVSVGLGTGNRDQMLQHLMQIVQLQGQIVMQQGGPSGPLVYPHNVYDALKALQENAGFKSSFFTDPSQPPPPGAGPPQGKPPDPAMMKAQAAIQAAQMKAQADAQAMQQKAQLEVQLQQSKAQMEAQLAQQKSQHEMAIEQTRAEHQMEMERQKSIHDIAIERSRAEADAAAKMREIELKYAAGAYNGGGGQAPQAPNGAAGV